MHTIIPFRIGLVASDYCSQLTEPLPPIQTAAQGVEVITQILAKEILCKHDVEHINQTYAEIDFLERHTEIIPEPNTKHVLAKIIEKVDAIIQKRSIRAEDWISLYHLKQFSDQQLSLATRFEARRNSSQELPSLKLDLATHLPFCGSEEQLNQAIRVLIEPIPVEDKKVDSILGRKRVALQQHERLKRAIADKKMQLQQLRQVNPQLYPPYLDALLDGGYLHLYDHLLAMRQLGDRNTRRSEIEKIPFFSLSNIVLETRESIIRTVECSIPPDAQNIVFLLGGSGAGKSTTLCFLRGDRMVLENFEYTSKSDKDQIIGDASAVSCTFLPTVEVVRDWVVVDFPGFDDSNGSLISMGMEFALKALVSKYRPQILVVESITNVEGRFAVAAALGSRLARLIENKGDCLLAITKYAKDPDYGRLKLIEETQKKERSAKSSEEITLEAQIQTLAGLNMPQLQPQIQVLQQQLVKIQEEKAKTESLPLPDTEEKQASRTRLEDREKELLKQIGLSGVIRLDTLDDPHLLSSCFKALAEHQRAAQPRLQQVLDPDHEKLLDSRFESDLQQQIAQQQECISIGDFKEFERIVLESSLINVIFCQTQPQVGHFLHVPEMDPRLVRKYDRVIVEQCIKKCIMSAIAGLNMAFVKTILLELKGQEPKRLLADLEEKSERLRNYILGLLGHLPEDQEQANQAWFDIQKEQKAAVAAIEQDYILPTWATVLLCLPLGIPYGIRTLSKWTHQNNKSIAMLEKLLKDCCNEIDQIQKALLRLKDLEKIIQKQEQIDQAFHSVPLSLESEEALIESMKNKILAVRTVYGSEEWDKQVLFLQKEIDFPTPRKLAMVAPVLGENLCWILCDHPILNFRNHNHPMLRVEHAAHSFILYEKHNSFLPGHIEESLLKKLPMSTFIRLPSDNIGRFIDITRRLTKDKMSMERPLCRAKVADALLKKFESHFRSFQSSVTEQIDGD